MLNDQPYLPRLGIGEQLVAEEMMRDQHSEHWEECSNFVKRCVHIKARNIPDYLLDDVVQDILYKIMKSLPHFRFQCTLRTWVNLIIVSCIIDARRRLQNEERSHFPFVDQFSASDREGENFITSEEKSAEDAFMINDEIRNGWAALLEYANTHSNPYRDQLIIWMVIHEGQTHAETAIAADCNAPVVGYVVREAQRYARDRREHSRNFPSE